MEIKEIIFNAKTKQEAFKTKFLTEQEIQDQIFFYEEPTRVRERIEKIKAQLIELNFDLLQDQAGLIVPNLNEKKAEFIELHNELRTLLGKQIREKK
jgi:hypothetical protein